MPDSVILRYRDVTGDSTIARHRNLITQAGYVWWGWWKKDAEPSRFNELQELAERAKKQKLVVGLFDRSTGEFYSAQMTDCVCSDAAISTPEPLKTPSYYSNEKLPAWLKLTSIDGLGKAEFLSHFKAIPVGEGTFFPFWRGCSGAISSPDFVRTSGNSVLHISDIHFGADFGFPIKRVTGATPLLEVLLSAFRGQPPAIIVVSGDLTTKADANVLQDEALHFLIQLSEGMKLDRDKVVIVPGNHDIALKKFRPTDYSHENSFHLFTKAFYGESYPYPGLKRFGLANGRQLEILNINSVRLRHERYKHFGYVQWALYEDILRAADYDPDVIRIATLHHHLVSGPREESVQEDEFVEASVSTTLDAGAVIEGLQSHNFTLALHGHQHVPALTKVARASVPNKADDVHDFGAGLVAAAAGSAGADKSRLSDEMRDNSFNVITFSERGFELEAKRFNPTLAPQRLYRFVGEGLPSPKA